MTKDERSLLMFLETREVDHIGLVAPAHMNAADFAIAEKWDKAGLVKFGRLKSHEMDRINEHRHGVKRCTHYVRLGESMRNLAARERQARADRCFARDEEAHGTLEGLQDVAAG